MKIRLILVVAVLAGLINLRGQLVTQAQPTPTLKWQTSFGGNQNDGAKVVKQTSDGGYIVGGYSSSGISGNKTTSNFGSSDYWIVKMDALGNKQWDQSYGGIGDDQLTTLQQTSDGGYILGGYSSSGISGNKSTANFGNYDYWVVKTDSNGVKQWDRTFGGNDYDALNIIQQTSDGGYILGGYTASGVSGNKTNTNFGFYDYWIVKLDGSGNKQWERSYGGSDYDVLSSLQQTRDGGYILGGFSLSAATGNKTSLAFGAADYWVVKTDSNGNKQWDRSFGGSGSDYFTTLQQTADDGYILGGYSDSPVSTNKSSAGFGNYDCWAVKIDAAGNKEWDQSYGGTGVDYLFSLQQLADGGFIFGGYSDSNPSASKAATNYGSYDYWLIKADATGAKVWDQSYGGLDVDYLFSLQQTSDNGFILGGVSYSSASGNKTNSSLGGADYWVLKLEVSNPTPVRFTSFLMGPNNIFQAQVSGLAGTSYILQASTTLTNWTSLSTNSSSDGTVNFSDTNAVNFPKRFYRVQQLP